ncbi:tyrosine-protein phosphatase non-receptor type 9 isoform X2 [Culicoides brevitarsis]|uniref:tyrosine-protein phosphatase non-receptor type 9 isoform X2 n=1 Tax=Culicoides brevitarsis TaxID=469753 RepID=UPI00307C473E
MSQSQQNTAVNQFLDLVNSSNKNPQRAPVTSAVALKFLFARKFDVNRAVQLFEQHELTRLREGLYNINPMTTDLLTELQTGKFTILPERDASGAAIALFTANLHNPEGVSHKCTLQGIVYQLDAALLDIQTQKAGLVFIYDMSQSRYSNFDYELSHKILTLLKGQYPARLRKVLIVTAPLWFKAPFKILRLFVKEKLRDRVFTVSVPQLSLHLPRSSLPRRLGGTLDFDHSTWLLHCYKSMTNREDEILANISHCQSGDGGEMHANSTNATSQEIDNQNIDFGSDSLLVDNTASGTSTTAKTDDSTTKSPTTTTESQQEMSKSETNQNTEEPEESAVNDWTENSPSSASSGFSDDDSLAGVESSGDYKTIEQIVEMVKGLTKQGLIKEYAEIRARPPDGTFTQARHRNNLAKNRYTDVLCYDHSRVILSQVDDDPNSDYINANFVDGYKQKNAYISTQGPLPKTSGDFWRMVWEQHCLVIVMTTRVMERSRVKCGQYWEPTEGGQIEFGNFVITTNTIDTNDDYTVASLEIKNTKTDETRHVSHWQFTSWPDYGVPASAMAMLNFLQQVREQQALMVKALGDTWAGHHRGPPIIVHCSAGIGRTGTFITLDICISRLEDVGTADVKGTVERIRSQRAYSIQMPDQYVFCHLALIEYAIMRKMLQSIDLTGFNDGDEDSE